MARWRIWARAWIGGASLFVAASCGGDTAPGPSGGSAASGASGGGAGSSGAPGGTGASGASGSNGGTNGNTLPPRCKLPAEGGSCNAYFPSYYHDAATGTCQPFVYGGCGGNDNRFSSLAECQTACAGGVPDMDSCGTVTDCLLVDVTCCGACEPVDASAYVAINRASSADFRASRVCPDIACGSCPGVLEVLSTSQYFVATCQAGQCGVLDIREHPVTECKLYTDCVLRDGANCCEGCDGTGLVAINRKADFRGLVCGGADVGCPPCAPIIPDGFAPDCAPGGRCRYGQLL